MCSISPGVHKTQRWEKNLNWFSALSPYLPSSFLVVFVRAFPPPSERDWDRPKDFDSHLHRIVRFVSAQVPESNERGKKKDEVETERPEGFHNNFSSLFSMLIALHSESYKNNKQNTIACCLYLRRRRQNLAEMLFNANSVLAGQAIIRNQSTQQSVFLMEIATRQTWR